MNRLPPCALIADDEPLLRQALRRQLAVAWPELRVVAEASNGREALQHFEALQPDICFLDVHMPGLSGIDAARAIGRRAHLVFVTAYDAYAVQAFEQGALDYLVKPVQLPRLTDTVQRLQQRVDQQQPASDPARLLDQLLERLQGPASSSAAPLRWIHASAGQTLRLIPVEDVIYLRADDKYTRVVWHDDGRHPAEALIRTPLKELLTQLDPAHFVQIHRAILVNLHSVSHLVRQANETGLLHLKQCPDVLPVSRSYLGLFRQM